MLYVVVGWDDASHNTLGPHICRSCIHESPEVRGEGGIWPCDASAVFARQVHSWCTRHAHKPRGADLDAVVVGRRSAEQRPAFSVVALVSWIPDFRHGVRGSLGCRRGIQRRKKHTTKTLVEAGLGLTLAAGVLLAGGACATERTCEAAFLPRRVMIGSVALRAGGPWRDKARRVITSGLSPVSTCSSSSSVCLCSPDRCFCWQSHRRAFAGLMCTSVRQGFSKTMLFEAQAAWPILLRICGLVSLGL